MKIWLLLAPLLAASALSGCVSYPVDAPPGLTLASPRRTTEYLKWAWSESNEHDKPKHVYNTLSEGFIQRHGVTLSDLEVFWNRVREELESAVGDVKSLEIVAERVVDARTRDVDFASGDRRASVRFVLETSYEVTPANPRQDSSGGRLPSMSAVVRYEGDAAVVVIDPVARQIPPEEIMELRIDNLWKIDEVLQHNVPEVDRLSRQGAASRPVP